MPEAPLSALCSVCYTNPPKYRCPQCPGPVRTCSLPCYKRHQQRASCTGQRDPTRYVKKSQLSTPAGIDHDYNFLTKIEKTLERSQDDSDNLATQVKKRWNSDGTFQKYLRSHNITVERAPHGMSRQKANQTRFTHKVKHVLWTVEWIDADGQRKLGEVDQDIPLAEAYQALLVQGQKAEKKRKRSADTAMDSATESTRTKPVFERPAESTKLDRDVNAKSTGAAKEASEAGNAITAEVEEKETREENSTHKDTCQTTPPAHDTNALARDTRDSSDATIADTSASRLSSEIIPSTRAPPDTRSLILERINLEKARQASAQRPKSNSPPPPEPIPIPQQQAQEQKQQGPPYFYLQRPHTPTSARVLIPLDPTASLTTSLRDRTVLEFPTVYVLEQALWALPAGFVTESAWKESVRDEEVELRGMMAKVPGKANRFEQRWTFGGGRDGQRDLREDRGGAEGEVDGKRILDMLRRDTTGH